MPANHVKPLEKNYAITKEPDIHIDVLNVGLSFRKHIFSCSNTDLTNLQTKIGHGII